MTEDDRQLQDYLDGRLSAVRREEFEARLRGEPALARELETYRRLGAALREGDATLPDAFYARARRRFIDNSSGSRSAGYGLLSWRTAGLAAAALLVAAIFLPAIREGRVGSEGAHESPSDATAEERPRQAETESPPAPRQKANRQIPTAPLDPPADAVNRADEFDAKRDAEDHRLADALAAPPAATGASAEQKLEMRNDAWRRAEAPAGAERRDRTPPAPSRSFAEAGSRSRVLQTPAAVELPAGWLAAGEFRDVTDLEVWRGLLDGPAGTALARLADPDASLRLVLIGPPADCAGLVVDPRPGSIRINVAPSGPGESRGGCALTLPADGSPIDLTRTGN